MIIGLSVKCGRFRYTAQNFVMVESEWDLLKLVKKPLINRKSWEKNIVTFLKEISYILVDIHIVCAFLYCRQSKGIYTFRYLQQEVQLLNLG